MSHRHQYKSPERRMSGFGIASLIMSSLSVFIGPFGFLPAIVLGHVARRETRNDPDLGGRGMALAGLIIGYVCLGIFTALVVLFLFSDIFMGRHQNLWVN